jgi:hypothetical protein
MFNYPGRKTILCIDDDDGVLGYHKALLERRGYKASPPLLPDKDCKLLRFAPSPR